MATSDVTVARNGGQGNAKIHPYFVTLVRWCISYVWGTASLLLHRLLTSSVPRITAPKQSPKLRQASTDHLHPEPRVECVVLYEPPSQPLKLDVIFVHGLYGSLGNTWKQGEWRSRYKLDPSRIPLRNHDTKDCKCDITPTSNTKYNEAETYTYKTTINENISFTDTNEKIKKILLNENNLITEQFYNDNLQTEDNYETQRKFVEELFNNDNNRCDMNNEFIKFNDNGFTEFNDNEFTEFNDNGFNKFNDNNVNGAKCKLDNVNPCECGEGCSVGCGCICDNCYSTCWPKDWIKADFPEARVISINYTSDPHLWRPLWVKQNQRLRLHERAEQMMEQLLALGVGRKPIIWVGHSKGGLFIKQIYCEAYNAYLQMNKHVDKNVLDISIKLNDEKRPINKYNKDVYKIECENNFNKNLHNDNKYTKSDIKYSEFNDNTDPNDNETNLINGEFNDNTDSSDNEINLINVEFNDNTDSNDNERYLINNTRNYGKTVASTYTDGNWNLIRNVDELTANINFYNNNAATKGGNDLFMSERNDEQNRYDEMNDSSSSDYELNDIASSKYEEDTQDLYTRSTLWSMSAGFMFYSVPHRGSPLADIKTPITARSIELLEIAKDCPLVLDLQNRWLEAAGPAQPVVRSLVETCRTLMSVLWLRIVSVDSADAGVGSLHGVSVDHREICKPSSRRCPLYQELKDVIQKSLKNCDCK